MENNINSELKSGRALTLAGWIIMLVLLSLSTLILVVLILLSVFEVTLMSQYSAIESIGESQVSTGTTLEFYDILYVSGIILTFVMTFVYLILGILICKKIQSDDPDVVRRWSVLNIVLSTFALATVVLILPAALSYAGGILLTAKAKD